MDDEEVEPTPDEESEKPGPTPPKPGDKLRIEDVEMIFQAVRKRQENPNLPDEDISLSFILVMLNIGDRFMPVHCVGGEWKALRQDIPPGEGLPTCPNGHPLTMGKGLTLGWLRNR